MRKHQLMILNSHITNDDRPKTQRIAVRKIELFDIIENEDRIIDIQLGNQMGY